MTKNIIEFIFSFALFINAIIFIPQAVKIFKEKTAKGVSLLTFIGFLLIQLTIVLHGIINHDHLLIFGYLLSMLTCGLVVFLALVYRRKNHLDVQVGFETILEQLPGHIYWKDKNGVLLGCNKNNWYDFGVKSLEDFVGKTDYDLFPKHEADKLRIADKSVMDSGEPKVFEESHALGNEKNTVYLSHKAPLRDKYNNIIGIIGSSVDITSSKREILEKLKTLEDIIAIMPGHVYWMSTEGVYLGCNNNQAKSVGFSSRQEIIGKRNSEIRGFLVPEVLDPINERVMKAGSTITTEEPAVLSDGTEGVFLSTKTPLYSFDNKVVGMVGVSIDITDRKKSEHLKLETEIQKAKLEEQENFRKIVDQVVHDIRSPLAALAIMMKYCESGDVPEKVRLTLQGVAASITDIANNLLFKYKKKSDEHINVVDKHQPIVVSLALLQILNEKVYQYKEQPVEFTHNFCLHSVFSFIKADLVSFKRMISNLLNNAVEALEGNKGVVDLKLCREGNCIKIIIKDDGKGMPQEIVNKIMNKIAVTSEKNGGSGIGYIQIWETLQRNQGELVINSKIGEGTEVAISFPIIETPHWFAKEIRLDTDDVVVVLDDDESIHHAWDMRLKVFDQNIVIKHFAIGDEVVNFINNFPQKDKIFLLADFELINQELNGIGVIEKTNVERVIIVTSHFTNPVIRDFVSTNEVKILPKSLVLEVPIEIVNREMKNNA